MREFDAVFGCGGSFLATTFYETQRFGFFQKLYGEFELIGVPEQKLCSQHWQNIEQRMQTEEAACVLTGAEADENG